VESGRFEAGGRAGRYRWCDDRRPSRPSHKDRRTNDCRRRRHPANLHRNLAKNKYTLNYDLIAKINVKLLTKFSAPLFQPIDGLHTAQRKEVKRHSVDTLLGYRRTLFYYVRLEN